MSTLTHDDMLQLAEIYDIPFEEVFLMALNRYGLRANTQDDRVRFVLQLPNSGEFYLAVCVNTGSTPFTLSEAGTIDIAGVNIAHVKHLEPDTCDATYFRRRGTELTLNSNSRSFCVGCAFCGTYNLDAEDQEPLNTADEMRQYLLMLMRREGLEDFSHLVRLTICTGCFEDEMGIVDHILMVRDVFAEFGFAGRVRYIGAQIGWLGLGVLARHLDAFSLSYTVECFSRRKKLLHPAKSTETLDSISEILLEARELGFASNFLYVMGLEDLNGAEVGFKQFRQSINRFPVVQILQRYTRNKVKYQTPAAQDFTYFLDARKMLERVYGKSLLQPRIWENYRGLWYLTYRGKELDCIRM